MMQGHQQFYNVGNKNTERSFKLVPKGRIYENKKKQSIFSEQCENIHDLFSCSFWEGSLCEMEMETEML